MGCGASNATETNPHRSHGHTNNSSGRVPALTQFVGENRPPSKRVTTPPPYKYGKSLTQHELERVREEFWSTRVEGNNLMWQALQSASDAILSKDLDLANAILEASNIVTPNANLELCYDERGYAYNVPMYCYAVPSDLTTGTVSNSEKTTLSKKDSIPKSSTGTQLKVKCRINPGDYNIVLDTMTSHTIADLKKQIYNYSAESNGKILTCEESLQRVMFMGKELQNNTTLKQAGIDDVRIVQIFIRPKKP